MELWISNQNQGCTEEDIAEFEKSQQLKLPALYKTLIQEQNGGLIKKNHFPTSEPTSYGIDHGEIYEMTGLERLLLKIDEEAEVEIPGRQVYFHQDGKRYIGFSYHSDESEPEIVYTDFETLQVLKVGDSFAAFVNKLYFSPFDHALLLTYPRAKLEQMLAMGNWQTRKTILFVLEDEADKEWYLQQIEQLVDREENIYDKLAVELLENQILYFKRKLPRQQVDNLLERLLTSEQENEKLNESYKEWHS